jgi:hypothetical protein
VRPKQTSAISGKRTWWTTLNWIDFGSALFQNDDEIFKEQRTICGLESVEDK